MGKPNTQWAGRSWKFSCTSTHFRQHFPLPDRRPLYRTLENSKIIKLNSSNYGPYHTIFQCRMYPQILISCPHAPSYSHPLFLMLNSLKMIHEDQLLRYSCYCFAITTNNSITSPFLPLFSSFSCFIVLLIIFVGTEACEGRMPTEAL